jgi:uncharacterized membrane protein YphA (DoxX/SURF4 family)
MSFRELLGHRHLIRASRIAIGLIFAVSGLAKVGDLQSFAGQIHNFRLMPIPLESLLAMTLPWVELVAAVALLLNIRARSAAVLVFGMMVGFTVAVALALVRGLDIECGCFGTADASTVGLVKILQNVGMTVLAFLAIGSAGRD